MNRNQAKKSINDSIDWIDPPIGFNHRLGQEAFWSEPLCAWSLTSDGRLRTYPRGARRPCCDSPIASSLIPFSLVYQRVNAVGWIGFQTHIPQFRIVKLSRTFHVSSCCCLSPISHTPPPPHTLLSTNHPFMLYTCRYIMPPTHIKTHTLPSCRRPCSNACFNEKPPASLDRLGGVLERRVALLWKVLKRIKGRFVNTNHYLYSSWLSRLSRTRHHRRNSSSCVWFVKE